ncbi:MAG: protein BatD [SAR324 cluster bacterium]|nr:protein BatD [SAR324 cluster bacterium]
MGIHIKKLILLLAIILAAGSGIRAEVKLEFQVSDTNLILGDEITAQLKVDGVKDKTTLVLPEMAGLAFRQLGPPSSSSQTVIINGTINRFSGLIYNIGISAAKKGHYTIPGIRLEYQNRTYHSKPFNIRVVSPDTQNSMQITLSVSSNQLFLDEPLVVTLKWFLQDSVQDYTFRFPLLEQKDRFQLQLAQVSGTGTTSELVVNSYKIPFQQGLETVNGEQYTVYQTALQIFPSESGMLTIPAASVKAMVKRGTELKRDFFDRIVRTPKLERIFAVSKELQVQVKGLPAENRPRYFTGGVGSFQIQVSTGQTRVKVGDPIELSIRITGKGRLSKIQQPVLNDNPAYKEHFVIADNLQPGDILEESITFRQMVRARNENVTRIPSIRFSFFDPTKRQYVTVESDEIPIKVLPTKQVTAEDIIVPGQEERSTGNNLLRQNRGIFGNYTFEDALTPQTRHPVWFLIFLLPPGFYFMLLWTVQRQRLLNDDLALVRARSAKGKSSRRLKKAKSLMTADSTLFLKELSLSLSGYISDKFNLGSGEVTALDIQQLAKTHNLSEQLAIDLEAHFKQFDRLRFSSQDLPPEERQMIFAAVDQTIKELGRKL